MCVSADDAQLIADILQHNLREGFPPTPKDSVAMDTEASKQAEGNISCAVMV